MKMAERAVSFLRYFLVQGPQSLWLGSRAGGGEERGSGPCEWRAGMHNSTHASGGLAHTHMHAARLQVELRTHACVGQLATRVALFQIGDSLVLGRVPNR